MASLLEERMIGSYTTLADESRLGPDTSLVKSYLVEARIPENSAIDAAQTSARQLLMARPLGRRVNLEVHGARDESLVTLEAMVALGPREERVVVYVDLSNPRFWRLHSMGSSNAVDYVVERLALATELDRVWLPADLLEAVSSLGGFRGLGLSYDRRPISENDTENEPDVTRVDFLKMQLWGNRAADILRILRTEDAFPHETTLSKVKVKYWQDRTDLESFALDDVKYDGKITARGTSFGSHISLLDDVYRWYAAAVRMVEDIYAIHIDQPGSDLQPIVHGEPITFTVQRPIYDLRAFCEHVFSGAPPFRIWGAPVRLTDRYYRVEGVDLHVGQTVRFEVTPAFVRLYLPQGACGNTAMRVYTNLQHHYDSLVSAVDGRNTPIFNFQ